MRLVHTFHSKVRHDAVLAPIFESNADDLARRMAGSLWYGYQSSTAWRAARRRAARLSTWQRSGNKKDQAMTHPSLTIICHEHRALCGTLQNSGSFGSVLEAFAGAAPPKLPPQQ